MKLGFIECPSGVITKPQSLVCYKILSNEVGAPEAREEGNSPCFLTFLICRSTGGRLCPLKFVSKKYFFRSALQSTYIISITIKSNNVCKITKTTMNHRAAMKAR